MSDNEEISLDISSNEIINSTEDETNSNKDETNSNKDETNSNKDILDELILFKTNKSEPSILDNILDIIKEKQNDQNFRQKMNVAFTLILEMYRVLMGALLVIFVPQKCDDNICSINQNIYRDDIFSQITISFNIITLISFLFLYFIEVKRENKLITYLDVNKFNSVDNDSVGVALQKLPIIKKFKILKYDEYYYKLGYISTSSFMINTLFSSIVIYSNYLNSKTLTVYLTNVVFMTLKISDVLSIINTKKNVFYSAYLKNKVQFNDVDPNKMITNRENEKLSNDNADVLIKSDSVQLTMVSDNGGFIDNL